MSVQSLTPDDKKNPSIKTRSMGSTESSAGASGVRVGSCNSVTVTPAVVYDISFCRKSALESVYSSSSRLNLLNKRKRHSPSAMAQGKSDRYVTQRVLSAKAHRVKQLQNQLSDAHYHLQELSNENKMLRALQKKQEIALQRYENSSAELPSVLHSHGEEIRIQTQKYKQLKAQLKDVSLKLKERDMQYQQLKDDHTHLLELSKDRHLLEREKLQAQVTDLTTRTQQQAETISMLQRRIALEAKNFRHQLQLEINKHKDTRHDLDMAINNADKLTTIIEMKEKLLSTAASRNLKSPTKTSIALPPRPVSKSRREQDNYRGDGDNDRTTSMDALTKLCENSRNITSSLSHEDDSSYADHRRYGLSRASSSIRSTPNPTRKNSKDSDEIIELAKTVQDGMADLTIFDEINSKNVAQEDMQKKIDFMKADLLNKIRNEDVPSMSRKSSFIRKTTEESIEEEIPNTDTELERPKSRELERPKSKDIEKPKSKELERPKSRGRRGSSVSFYSEINYEENTTTAIAKYNAEDAEKSKKEAGSLEKKLSGKPIEKYCKEIMHGIEKSTKSIDRHMKNFSQSQFHGDKLVEQLNAVDSLNEFVNANGEIPEDTLNVLNNNFKMLTEQVFSETPTRQRAISGNKRSRETRSLLNDGMSNQEMLDDLLGRN